MKRILFLLMIFCLMMITLFAIQEEAEPFYNQYMVQMTELLSPNAKTISKMITQKAINWAISGDDTHYADVRQLISEYSDLEDVKRNQIVKIFNNEQTGKLQMRKIITQKLRSISTENGLKVYALYPLSFYTAGKTTLTFLIGNDGSQVLENINIEVSKIESEAVEGELSHNDDYSEGIDLKPGEIGILQITVSTDLKTVPGDYALFYTLLFDDSDGLTTENEECVIPIQLTGPNDTIKTIEISPEKFYRGSKMYVVFDVLNKGNVVYKDINIEIESIQREIYLDSLSHNDDYEEGITLEPNESGQFTAVIDTDLDDPEGPYDILYYYSFDLENGDSYRTPLYHSVITVIPANSDIQCTDLQPDQMNQNSKRMLTWYIRNTGTEKYLNINIENDGVYQYYFGESLSHNDDVIEGIDLLPNLNAKLMTAVQTDANSPLGQYALQYYFLFEDTRGNYYRSDDLFKTIEVISAYDLIKCVDIEPKVLSRQKDVILNFSIKNTGGKLMKNIAIEVNDLFRELYGESLSWNDDVEEGFDLKPEEVKRAMVRVRADKEDIPGRYVLRYSLFFEDEEENRYETEEQYTILILE
ncbi:MAG TPA: hypothetical protein PLB99_00555 [Thermotogota bacterium]|nr:hypothetical protein [Thermotogota bacterium]